MNLLPEPINDRSELLWLEMLADGELNSDQRNQLFEYFDEVEGGWKRCARYLLHEDQLGNELKAVSHQQTQAEQMAASSVVKKTDHNQRSSFSAVLAACVAFVLGLGVALPIAQSRLSSEGDLVSDLSMRTTELASKTFTDTWKTMRRANYQPSEVSLTFFEIENTPTSATYYLQQPLPEIFLQSLVLAGHSVKVDQEIVEVSGPDGVFPMPVNKLEIDKFTPEYF